MIQFSDSDSDSDYDGDYQETPAEQCMRAWSTNTMFDEIPKLPPDEVFDRWCYIPIQTRRDAGQLMKVCSFWLPMLLQPESSSPSFKWALHIGIANRGEDIKVDNLHKIETLELIMRALEIGTYLPQSTKHVLGMANEFIQRKPQTMEDALFWLERSGAPTIRDRIVSSLGTQYTAFKALHLIFTEFAKFVVDLGSNFERTMKALKAGPPEGQVKKSEEMKTLGNEHFKRRRYDEALRYYSRAIKLCPDNHIIYGNRAQCYIRCKKYLKAVADGKKAILIDPEWSKGHYRYCEALFLLGEWKLALEASKVARNVCRGLQEGARELEEQHERFITEIDSLKVAIDKKSSGDNTEKVNAAESRSQPVKPVNDQKSTTAPQNKVAQVKTDKQSGEKRSQSGKNEKAPQAESSTKDSKALKSNISSMSGKGESNVTVKKKTKKRNSPSEDESQREENGKVALMKEVQSAVQDAHTALSDLRYHYAATAFERARELLCNYSIDCSFSNVDHVLLMFGRVSALTEIGQTQDLKEAKSILEDMKRCEARNMQALIFYASGKVFLKENRFAQALQEFSDAMQVIRNQILPGKLTWTSTKEIVKETQPDYLKEVVQNAMDVCRFPPPPDAVCRSEKCLHSMKTEIYFTDPDFKGFIQICCCQNCIVEYHMACWKTFKTIASFEKNEKDFLQDACFTPDCVGKICSIKIIDPAGLVKCKFEAAIINPPTPKKMKVNQKCTSLKKLKSKEEHRLKRKQHKQVFQEKQSINDGTLEQEEESAPESEQKAWLLYRDRVLLQIYQNKELLREETGVPVSALSVGLKPWLELDSARGNQLAAQILCWGEDKMEAFGQAVDMLLERKNRVWARVFIQLLSSSSTINPKLHSWACQLNDAGLNAAKSFIERYAGHLEQLDLSFLLNFGPLQEVIIDKLGTRPELFSSIGLTVTEYLKQAPAHDMRLFIWTLEEHRDGYLSCGTILDEYFDMMDGNFSVLKKSDEDQNNSPSKSRGKKKKVREPRAGYFRHGMDVVAIDENGTDYFVGDDLSYQDTGDPFSVPSHLRERVADFENSYNNRKRESLFKSILDNNPDPTKESLYDYFAQILEEHGPLVVDDPLLVGELVNFPPVVQQKIQACGGFHSFLLESLRFIKMGRRIGLAKHAVSLQQAGHVAPRLDDLDDLDSDSDSSSPDLPNRLAHTAAHPILPSPYVFGSFLPPPVCPNNTGVTFSMRSSHSFSDADDEQDLYTAGDEDSLSSSSSGKVAEGKISKKHAEVQTSCEAMRSVAVNTEHYERFEMCPGGINSEQRSNNWMQKQIQAIENDKTKEKVRKEIHLLEDELQKLKYNIQVTNTELTLFQQKLEEEVNKDIKEKKANQDVLKALKLEIKDLLEQHASLNRNIREKKDSYDQMLKDFLQMSNQLAAERLSLQENIKHSKVLLTSASRRSHAAQLLAVETSRDRGLFVLYRERKMATTLLTKLDQAAQNAPPNPNMDMIMNTWRTNIQTIEKELSTRETHFQEQANLVKADKRTSDLSPVNVSPQPEPAGAAALSVAPPSSSSSHSSSSPEPQGAAAAAPPPQHKPPTRAKESTHGGTVFEKSMERLSAMFPDYSRSDLMRFVQELRSSSGGTLSSMALQDIVGGATQLILDHQERVNAGARASSTPSLTAVWQPLGPHRGKFFDALNVEDPCIICHDDMSPHDICVLECRHSFHKECIRSWLKEQSTCPTCRDHALLPEEFPALHGRKRQC